MQKVFIIGGTTFDHIVHLPQLPQPVPQTIHQAAFHEGTGSTGSGKALNLHKLGVPLEFYSVLGKDAYGAHIEKDLAAAGVPAFYDYDPAGTERHINIMDATGNRISIFITQSSEQVDYSLQPIQAALASADIIVLNIISYCRGLASLVTATGKPVWTDLHDYDGQSSYHTDFINAAQYIHLSSDNLADYRSVMQRFINEGKKLVVCTHGKAGATVLTPAGEWIEQPALLQYPMVDANGAGDAFFSGFLFGWMQEKPIKTCMQFGAVCAGLCIGSAQLAAGNLTAGLLEQEWRKQFENG